MNNDQIKEDSQQRYKLITGIKWWLFLISSGVGILLCLTFSFHFDMKLTGHAMMEGSYLALLLALFMPLVYFIFPITKDSSQDHVPWYDFVLAGLAFISPLWAAINSYEVAVLGLECNPPILAKISGVITLLLIVESSRRTTGLAFSLIVLVFSIYPIFSNYMPGFLLAKGYSFSRIIGYHYLGIESIFGLPMHVYGRLIIGFIIYAVALQITGGGAFFLDLAQAILGRVRGGPAKVSIIASAFFGSISGSVVANIATTGAITIPTMKRTGYPAYYAAAVEACASTGGVLMPPIMGVTAFIMAELLGMPYFHIIVAAIVPSFLYYFGMFLQVDGFAAKKGLKGLPEEEAIPSLGATLKWGWPYLVSIIILLIILGWFRLENWAAWFAAAFLFIAAMFRKQTRLTPQKIAEFTVTAGKVLAELTVIVAGVGIIIGSLTVTGSSFALARQILVFAGDNVFILLLFGALTAFILGIGLTISAAYIILAVILAPPLIQFGLDTLAVHLFLMYCGMLSYLTPPVAIGAYTAAGMASAPPMKTAFQSMKLGMVKYVIPFLFVLQPALLIRGPVIEILQSIAFAIIGVGLMASSMEGYLLVIGKISFVTRIPLFVAGFLFAYPSFLLSIIGFMATIFIILLLIFKNVSLKKKLSLDGYRE